MKNPVMMCLREGIIRPDEVGEGWVPGGKCADCGTGIFVPTPEFLESHRDDMAIGMDEGRVGFGKVGEDVEYCCGPCTINRAYAADDWQSAVALSELVRQTEDERSGR